MIALIIRHWEYRFAYSRKVAEVMGSNLSIFKAQGDKGWAMMLFHILRHAITPALCLQFASIGELLGNLLAEKVLFILD